MGCITANRGGETESTVSLQTSQVTWGLTWGEWLSDNEMIGLRVLKPKLYPLMYEADNMSLLP